MQQELRELESWMRDHDWYWRVRSDPQQRIRGEESQKRIRARCQLLREAGMDPEVYRLWQRWCPLDDLK